MPKVSEAHRDAMRTLLTDAAATVFARKGLAGTTVRDVLAEAGVAPGTLYAYFDGKEALVEALAERALNSHLAALEAAGTGAKPEDIFEWMLGAAMTQPFPSASVLAELRGRVAEDELIEQVRRINSYVVAMTRPLVERVRESGALDTEDVEALIEFLDIVWDGMTRRAANKSFATSYERVGQTCMQMLHGSVLKTKRRP